MLKLASKGAGCLMADKMANKTKSSTIKRVI